MENYLGYDKEGNPDICDNMDGPRGHYGKWNKPDRKDKYYMVSLIRGLNKKGQAHRNRK